jgi:hypothetical protein
MAERSWPAETYPFECPHYTRALDPHIGKAYWGYDAAADWPYTRIIPKGNEPKQCDYCAGTIPVRTGFPFAHVAAEARPASRTAARAAERPSAPEREMVPESKAMKVEFFYSSKHEPGPQFRCDNKKAIDLLKQLQQKGVGVKIQNTAEQPAAFASYNAAVTGPPSAKRSVFGAKGALEEDFGKTVPALLVFGGGGDRYPSEVYPRTDRELDRLIGVEEALQGLLEKL